MEVTRRTLMGGTAVGAAAAALGVGGCSLFTENANGSYGLSPAVIAAITSAVQAVAQYAPAIESIAATAASLFGAQYAAIVTIGSSALGQVISYLENLVAAPPALGDKLGAGGKLRIAAYSNFGIPAPSGSLVGYTKTGVPVFAK